MLKKFWEWYNRHYILNLAIAAGLFLLQLVHLYWLGADVIAERLTGISYFPIARALEFVVIFIDYTEIPAIITTSLVYINEWRAGKKWKAAVFLILLNSQWLHIFWITDEFVVDSLTHNHDVVLPSWLAWVAILIDYLEIPVIIDTIRKLYKAIKARDVSAATDALKN